MSFSLLNASVRLTKLPREINLDRAVFLNEVSANFGGRTVDTLRAVTNLN